jgi:transcriptional regulator with XRE-family HTH domain
MIGNRFKELRIKKNMTQLEFGRILGVSKKHIWEIEKDKTNISELLLGAVCAKFGVSQTWLTTGQGEMFNHSKQNRPIVNEELQRYELYPYDPPDLAELVDKFVYIMRSDDTVTKEALKQNVIAFHVSVRRAEGKPTEPGANDFKSKRKRAV